MKDAISLIRWAILFIVMDINIGHFDILPAFVAYGMYISCLDSMKEEYPDLLRLKSFCVFLVIVNLFDWIVKLNFPLITLIATILELYVTYTLLTAMAEYGIKNGLEGAASLQRHKNKLIIFRVIIFVFVGYLDETPFLMIPFWILYMLLMICILACLTDMKNHQDVSIDSDI